MAPARAGSRSSVASSTHCRSSRNTASRPGPAMRVRAAPTAAARADRHPARAHGPRGDGNLAPCRSRAPGRAPQCGRGDGYPAGAAQPRVGDTAGTDPAVAVLLHEAGFGAGDPDPVVEPQDVAD